ncbi:Protein CBR-INFT-2 [Caenorhabditis briggsae]|uniref:Protein CBR-INFT-2 n=1 Tax=Caenorhabditis briggsae TaxID=6238 RepID=B0K075_CAEBR|nr:Protein CBR-INFT-2 [Caenorhabditis briggsae]CAP29119.4 Protein CBR-INFT-2 [Caenorhabditis briggsae]
MAKKRTNSKKNQKRNDQTAGSQNTKSPPHSDASRPASRVSNPSDVENSGQKNIPMRKKPISQKSTQIFGNKASQMNIPAKIVANKPVESTVNERCVDLGPMSSTSSSRLDDTDVHIRHIVANFRGNTKKLEAIADINFMIDSTSSYLQRFTIRNKLRSNGLLSALAAHVDCAHVDEEVDAQVRTYLESEKRDARLLGLPDDSRSPIEALAKVMLRTTDLQWKKMVSLQNFIPKVAKRCGKNTKHTERLILASCDVNVLDFIGCSEKLEECIATLSNVQNDRKDRKDSEVQTDKMKGYAGLPREPSLALSTTIPEESAVFCDYSTSDDESKLSHSDPTTPDALMNRNLKKWATATDLPSQAKTGVDNSFFRSSCSASTFSSDDDGPLSPAHDSALPAINEVLDSSEETESNEMHTGLDTTLPVKFADSANIAFIDEASSTSSLSDNMGFSEIMTMSFEMVDSEEKSWDNIPPISTNAPPPPPPPVSTTSMLPPISSTAPPPPPLSNVIAPVSSNAPPPPPPPRIPGMAPLATNAPPPPTLPPMPAGMAPLSRNAPPPPPPPTGSTGGPPPAPPLPLDMLKGAAAGLRTVPGGPPPPPPPPPPSFMFNGNASNAFSPGSATSPVLSPGIVKSAVVYRKQKKTAFVRWPKLTNQMQDAGTVFNDSLCVDFNEEERSKMEEVFEEAPIKQLNRKIGGSVGRVFGKSLRATTSSSDVNTISARSPTTQQVLVSPKALTIEILIKKLKPLDFTELIDKLERNETDGIKVDLMTTLNKNFPDKDELDPFLKVEYRTLTHASDQFCWHIARNKHLRLRIELFITKENLTAEIGKFQTQIELLQSGCTLARGEVIQVLLRKCLQYGNYLNQGSMFAEAAGFQFSYLLQLLQMKGKGQHVSVKLVDLIVAFCDLQTNQLEEIQAKMVSVRPLNLKDLEDAVGQVQRTIRKLDGQMRASNVEPLIAAYQPFMEQTSEKLQNVQNGLSDVKTREMELQVYLCAGNMTLQAIFETLEQSMKIVMDAVKQAASKARVTRASSMVSLSTTSVSQRSLREGEILARKSMALKSRDLPVEELKKFFSHSSFGPQRTKKIPASPLTTSNISPTRTIRRRSGESFKEQQDEAKCQENNEDKDSDRQLPTAPLTPVEPPSVSSLRRDIRDLSSLVGSPV